MKKKFIWINILVAVAIFISSGLICAYAVSSPINLSEDDIAYYTEVAKNFWYNGLDAVENDDKLVIKYDLEAKTVRVSSGHPNAQSVTVDFSKDENNVIINKPSTSFVGCFFFYGFFFTLFIWIACVMTSDIFTSSKKHKRNNKQLKNSRE